MRKLFLSIVLTFITVGMFAQSSTASNGSWITKGRNGSMANGAKITVGTYSSGYGGDLTILSGSGYQKGGNVYIKASGGYYGDGAIYLQPLTQNGNGGVVFVDGKLTAEELEVDNVNLPDYVFEDDYKLISIPELEKYIKENKHLPEVPSASEVAENGMNITEMNNALLKKIEELTLYVIEQNKKIEEQGKKIEALEKKGQ